MYIAGEMEGFGQEKNNVKPINPTQSNNVQNRPLVKRIKWCFLGFFIFITISTICVISLVQYEYSDQVIFIDVSLRPHKVNEKFLSLGLDSYIVATRFKHFNMSSVKLIQLIKHLTPCYLRLGGNLADKLVFVSEENSLDFDDLPPMDDCIDFSCFSSTSSYNLSGSQWLRFNKFVEDTESSLIFDVNALLRNSDGSWNSTNAKELIKFSSLHNLELDWELGNEPNSFFYNFNITVNASQLSKDFSTFKDILVHNDFYKKSLLLGPSITRIRTSQIAQYFRTYLQGASKIVSAITWHHYYFSGRNATPNEFLDTKVFDLLKLHIDRIHRVIRELNLQFKPLWLGETSSAWGGGAPNMSNTFIDTFIWIDKLGLAAKMGIGVVIRQSIFGGYYALLDHNYDPNPDYWIALLYKQLVDITVLPSVVKYDSNVRLYAHCAKKIINNFVTPSSVVVFGLNVDSNSKSIRFDGIAFQPLVKVFELTTDNISLLSKNVFLNGQLLHLKGNYDLPDLLPKIIDLRKTHISMPAYSVCFWLLELDDTAKYCKRFKDFYAD